MKKLYGITIALAIYLQGIAQTQQIGEIDCKFASGASVVVIDKKYFSFAGENCKCDELIVVHENGNDNIEVGPDCKVDVRNWLEGGVTKMKLTVMIKGESAQSTRTLNILTSEATRGTNTDSNSGQNQVDNDNADNMNSPLNFGANILPDGFLKLKGTTCLSTNYEGLQSKVIEYNVCCNRFYYNYYPGKNFFPLRGKDFKTKSGTNKWNISKQDLFSRGTRVFVNDPLVFKISNINYRDYLTSITRNYTSENDDIPVLFEKAFSSDGLKFQTGNGCKEDIQLWLYNKTSQLTSYFEGLPDCMTVDQFNNWNMTIKENLTQSFKDVCEECEPLNLDIVSCIQWTFFEELSGSKDKEEGEESEESQIKTFFTLYYALDKKIHDLQYNVPQVKNYDEIEFTLNILPKDSSAGIYLTDEKVSIPVFGGFKIDGSSGLFYSSLTDHKFSTFQDSVQFIAQDETISYQNGNRIIRQHTSTGDPGLAGLVHFYSRWGKSLNLAFTLGAGFTFKENPEARYLVGGSVLLGRKERIAISYGAAFGQVTRLKQEFESPGLYDDVSNITTKTFDTGYFLSLSYNIPFRKKTQQVAKPSATPSPTVPTMATQDMGESEGQEGEESQSGESEEEEEKGNGNEDGEEGGKNEDKEEDKSDKKKSQ